MASQEGGPSSVGVGSPLGPDSTWGEAEFAASKMEARFVQLEAKLLKDQEEKFNKLMEAIKDKSNDSGLDPVGTDDNVGIKLTELQNIIEQKCLPCVEKILPVIDNLEKSDTLVKSMNELKAKVELLLGGENEANKLIDSIVPNVDKVKSDIKKLEQYSKDANEKLYKSYDEVKKIRDEQKKDHVKLDDLYHLTRKIRDDHADRYSRLDSKLDELKHERRLSTSERKRARSGSDSSDNDSRNRHSRSRSKKRRVSRENSSSSLQTISRTKEHEFEKLLMQINQSLELQRDSIEKLNKEPLRVLEEQIMPNIFNIRKLLEAGNLGPVIIPTSKWEDHDDGRSPSPLQRSSRSPHKLAHKLGLESKMKSKEEKTRKSKKKHRSASRSSSSSSDDERNVSKMDQKDMFRSMQVMVTTVAGIEEKVKELMKGNKKSNNKVEENCREVLERVGEMTLGVQVIAENLDSVNDVSKKMEILGHIESSLTKLGRLDEISMIRASVEKLKSEKDEIGWGEPNRLQGGIGHDEMRELVKHMDIDQKFCEFGGLVEELSSKVDKKLSQVCVDKDKERLKRLEGVYSALAETSSKTFKTVQRLEEKSTSTSEILPAVQELLRIGGIPNLSIPPPSSPSGSYTPPHPPPNNTDSSSAGVALSDYKITQLDRKIGEILPKLDDMYIKVLPCLDEIKQRQRKEAEKENITVREIQECATKVEKVMFMVEDIVESRNEREPGSLDRRINATMEMEGVMNKLSHLETLIGRQQNNVGECLNALVDMRTFTAKQSSIDRIERLLAHRDEPVGVSGEDGSRLDRKLTTVLEFLKKEEKTLEMFMKNSMSDAKLLSQCNTSIQGMKAAVSANGKDILLAVQSLGEELKRVEVTVSGVKTDLGDVGGSLDEIGGLVRNMERESGSVGSEVVSKLQTSIDRMSNSLKSWEKTGKSIGSRVEKSTTSYVDDSSGNNSEIKSQLDDLHDMVAQYEDTLTTGLSGVKAEVNKHDKNIGLAVNKLVKLLQASIENFNQLRGDLVETENRIKKYCEDSTTEILEHVDGSTEKIIKESKDVSKENTGHNESHPDIGSRLDTLVNKLDKQSKIVSRIKYLVEDESDDEEESKKRKKGTVNADMVHFDTAEIEKQILDVSRKIDLSGLENRLELIGNKVEKMDRDTSEKKMEDLLMKMDILEDNISRRIEDELSSSSGNVDKVKQLVMEIKNVVTEVGDRMISKRGFESVQDEVRQRLSKIEKGLETIPDEFGSQAAAMEENLCVNVVGSVKDVFKLHWDDLMNEIDQILGKLNTIKRYAKFGGKDRQEDGDDGENSTLENIREKINDLLVKVSDVHGALESGASLSDSGESSGGPREKLGNALLLSEIRKLADCESVAKLRQEMFTAVHNVQRRLLEEQARLVTELSQARGEPPQPNILTLIECLNKVRESQTHIAAGQESAILTQAETNKLLDAVVNNLEEAHNLLDRDSVLPQKISGRFLEICDDLSAAVTGLVTAQEQMGSCGTSNMEQLDRIIKSASCLMREDANLSVANSRKRAMLSESGPGGKKRVGVSGIRSLRRDVTEEGESIGSAAPSSSPMSEGCVGDGVEPNEGDWDPPVLRQPSVLVRQAILTPRQRAELRKFSRDEDKEGTGSGTEIKDEFASPEKSDTKIRTDSE